MIPANLSSHTGTFTNNHFTMFNTARMGNFMESIHSVYSQTNPHRVENAFSPLSGLDLNS
jgi:hypothetical protein